MEIDQNNNSINVDLKLLVFSYRHSTAAALKLAQYRKTVCDFIDKKKLNNNEIFSETH